MKKILYVLMLSIGMHFSVTAAAGNICDVSYQSPANWGTGAQEDVILTNRSSAKSGWELCWTFNGAEEVTNLWNGSYTTSGRRICVRNASSNSDLPTNGSVSFGFIHNNLPGPKPTDFALNGAACSGASSSSPSSSKPSSSSIASSVPAISSILVNAENFSAMNGIETQPTSDVGGGLNIGWLDTGDWATYPSVNLPCSGNYFIEYRVASASGGGQVALERAGGSQIYGTANIPSTGGWQVWQTISHRVTLPAGNLDFGLAIKQGGWNLNWFRVTPECLIQSSSKSSSSSIRSSSSKSSSSSSSSSSVPFSSSSLPSSSSSLSSSSVSNISGWSLNAAESYLNFVSTKKIHVMEVGGFSSLSGDISANGAATLTIDLNSVGTNITLRDQRLRDILFETAKFPVATVTVASVDQIVAALNIGETSISTIDATLDLHGISLPINTKIYVQKLSATKILVKNHMPLIIKASDYSLSGGLESLRAIAGLDSISNIVPVDFLLMFDAR